MSVKAFEPGKYYRWKGGNVSVERCIKRNPHMAPMLDGQARKCLESHSPRCAAFEGIEDGLWAWFDLSCFEEVVSNEDAEPYPGFFAQGAQRLG